MHVYMFWSNGLIVCHGHLLDRIPRRLTRQTITIQSIRFGEFLKEEKEEKRLFSKKSRMEFHLMKREFIISDDESMIVY